MWAIGSCASICLKKNQGYSIAPTAELSSLSSCLYCQPEYNLRVICKSTFLLMVHLRMCLGSFLIIQSTPFTPALLIISPLTSLSLLSPRHPHSFLTSDPCSSSLALMFALPSSFLPPPPLHLLLLLLVLSKGCSCVQGHCHPLSSSVDL